MIFVAHNADFDMGTIRACAPEFGLSFVPNRYFCTVELSRAMLPDQPDYKLDTLARFFGDTT